MGDTMQDHEAMQHDPNPIRTYWVSYPTVGTVSVEVEASSEEEAIELGWNLAPQGEHTWEPMEHIVQGNIFYGQSNDIEVECDD